jgi:hypothetical protein
MTVCAGMASRDAKSRAPTAFFVGSGFKAVVPYRAHRTSLIVGGVVSPDTEVRMPLRRGRRERVRAILARLSVLSHDTSGERQGQVLGDLLRPQRCINRYAQQP